MTLPDRAAVQQIDPATLTVRDTISLAPTLGDRDRVRLGLGDQRRQRDRVSRRSEHRRSRAYDRGAGGPTGIAVDDDGIWVASSFSSSISRIDPETGDIVVTIGVGDRPVDLAVRRNRHLGGERRLRHRLPRRP